jgi:hypothetical protein
MLTTTSGAFPRSIQYLERIQRTGRYIDRERTNNQQSRRHPSIRQGHRTNRIIIDPVFLSNAVVLGEVIDLEAHRWNQTCTPRRSARLICLHEDRLPDRRLLELGLIRTTDTIYSGDEPSILRKNFFQSVCCVAYRHWFLFAQLIWATVAQTIPYRVESLRAQLHVKPASEVTSGV